LAKPFGGICPIVMGKMLSQSVNKALCMQFCDVFASHLSPYKFRQAIKEGCEAVVHVI
jgi:hypothetical protein